jgi:catechol 2,3-dioxygenase-like lactoylglutathione lyase family enzyme
MKLKEIRPMIYTKEIKDTIDFYTNKLGFTCGEYNEGWSWAAFHRDSVEIMAAMPNEHIPFEKPLYTGSFYFTVEDVDMLWTEFKDKAKVCYPIENFEHGMREFAIYDNNGYLLQFGEEIS